MNRSRSETMRERKRKRRGRYIAIAICLAVGIGGILAWNGITSLGRQAGEQQGASQQTDPPEQAPEPELIEKAEPARETESTDEPLPSQTDQPSGSFDQASELKEGRIRLAFVGDVLLGEYVGTLMEQNGYDYPYVYVKSLLQEADITAANLETSVTGEREKPGSKQYEFRSAPEALPAFAEAGFDLVSLANNHTMDYGEDGLRDTIDSLDDNHVLHVGAGEDADEAYAPVYIEKNGLIIAYLGFSRVIPFGDWKAGKGKMGVAETYDYTRPIEEIKRAREKADIVVVMVHWGEERMLEAHPIKQTELGRRYIDAGADLVIGTHPHVLQGIESYKDKWIVYSLGNFIFTKSRDPLTYESGILYADCSESGSCGLQFRPIQANTPQPALMDAEPADKVLDRITSLSKNAALDKEGYVNKQ